MEHFAKLKYGILILLSLFLLQGCDWVKGQLGMPTSGDIARMKEELQQKEAADLQAAKEAAARDSLAKLPPAEEAVEGYYVIIGSFKDYANADALASFVEGMGYHTRKIPLKNGYMMVSVGEYPTVALAMAQLRKIEGTEVCPYDVWVYGSGQGLHK